MSPVMEDAFKEFADLDQISNAEFREQIKNWIEDQGIHANLQLQMKKDLIDQISRTALGRKIALKLQTQQGIVLSPLVLVLNTLVAEFLYTQNCHFSLSVFSNEVPFKNTLPDFARSGPNGDERFRLSHVELKEIFEALGLEHYGGLVEKYEGGKAPDGRSLLYVIVKSLLSSVKSYEEKLKKLKQEEVNRKENETALDGLEIGKLHRNVEKLLQRVRIVGRSMERVEKLQPNESNDQGKQENNSWKECTENVGKMISRMEVCSKRFEDLLGKIQEQLDQNRNVVGTEKKEVMNPEAKSYTDFLNELKSTQHGKKYVAKLQKQILKLMEKEKTLIEAKYRKKLYETELECKTKIEKILDERIREVAATRDILRSPRIAASGSEENVLMMKKIEEKLQQMHEHERNVDRKLVTLKDDLKQHELRQSKYFQSLKSSETKEKKLLMLQDVERKLLASFEDETHAMIRNAKATIEHLETESDKINRSFQQYLHKQREDKRRLNDEKVEIWQRYNDEKMEFNQRELIGFASTAPTASEPIVRESFVPQSDDLPNLGSFENPFRTFDPHKYLKRPKICNIVLVTPKPHEVADVAVNTSLEFTKLTSVQPVVVVSIPPAEPTKTLSVTSKHPSASNRDINMNVNLLEKARLDAVPSNPIDLQKHLKDPSKITDILAKDTIKLKQSIEENLQKLDQMSKTYTKSSGSSSGDNTDRHNTFNVKPSIHPVQSKSLDEVSSGAELGEPSSDSSSNHLRKELKQSEFKLPDLDSTKDLLEFAEQNFPITNDKTDSKKPDQKSSLELVGGSLGSLSDLDLSVDDGKDSGSPQHSVQFPGVDADKSKDSIDEILERISTGKRSVSGEDSWN
ncbi:centriole and centriolar satellite protein OFD1 [Uranotaenia lowii]|uniref:centriole and centriolar satellite protein OFD1 n=1 Tax=Uranotaenia lowii TaxID=190385 RepID=UPI0024788F8C|nr:centriole and centriolar satellite protein OFD1 [Uranotaenia lowii]